MKEEIEAAIKILAQKAKTAERPNDSMQFAQAALNLAHVYLSVVKKEKE